MSNTTQALSRIEAILDDSSFVEIGAGVTARSTDFNIQEKKAPSDGVITGYGVINGNLVYVYSQDATVLNGSIGEMHAKKMNQSLTQRQLSSRQKQELLILQEMRRLLLMV